jgi:hypothetical protein
LTESIDERVYFVRSKRWIAYPKAVEILGHLTPCSNTHERRGCHRSLSMETAAWAKSMLVEKFKDDYAQTADDRPSGPKTKLLVVELAGRPNQRWLYAQILAVVGAPQNRARQSSSWSGRQSAFLATSACKSWSGTRSITFSQRPGGNHASPSIHCAT